MSEKIMCVTTFSDKGYEEYGKKMIKTFDKYWDKDIELMVFSDSPIEDIFSSRILNHLLGDYPYIQIFTGRHKNNPIAHGKQPTRFWQEKENKTGYSFRFDAVRFHYSAMVPLYAAQYLKKGILIFLDGDVITTAPITVDWINDIILPKKRNLAYLGRVGNKSTETGFVAYRLPEAMEFLQIYHDVYVTDEIFSMGETANAYIFDKILNLGLVQKPNNMTPHKGRSHVWLSSPLAKKMIHLKGTANKAAGKQIIS